MVDLVLDGPDGRERRRPLLRFEISLRPGLVHPRRSEVLARAGDAGDRFAPRELARVGLTGDAEATADRATSRWPGTSPSPR
jgi:hypothetical protein